MKKIFLALLFLTSHSLYSNSMILQHLVNQKPSLEYSSKGLLDSIVLRFYHIQRLAKGVRRLLWMSHKQLVPLDLHCEVIENKHTKTLVINNNSEVTFTHPRIISCIEHIENYHSLVPFVEIWDDLIHYQLVNDSLVLHEFTCLLFYLYKDVVHQEAFLRSSSEEDQEALEEILQRAPSLETADLEEILDVLDVLIDELPAFIEKYELTSSMTWIEWLKKYWLLAPVGMAALILRIYLKQSLDKKADKIEHVQLGLL